MGTEVWYRNPKLYIRECVELGLTRIAWDRGFLVKHKIDPTRFVGLHLPASFDYRLLLIGDQGTAELTRRHDITNPRAVYPTWVYGHDDIATLEDWLASPVGDDPRARDPRLPPDERPVEGQEHRVVITDTPPASTGLGRRFYALLAEMQADYPDAIVHVHGLYSYRVAFGFAYNSVDVEPRTLAQKGKVSLPNGREVTYEVAARTPQWVELVGFQPSELAVPRNRCMFNMKSAEWAAEHYRENINFRVRGTAVVDPKAKKSKPATGNRFKSKSLVATVGDKVICDTCSLKNTCKYFRDGSVCSLPDSDGSALAKQFKTRDSGQIIDGLADLMAEQVKRMETGRRIEDEDGVLMPEVTKIIDGLFEKGVKLAKLVDPSLTKPSVQVGVQINGNGAVALPPGASDKERAAGAVAALEAHGYTRAEMTAALIEAVMNGMPVPRKAITTTSSDE